MSDRRLLSRVIEFKQKFYWSPWANLGEALPPTLRLVPPEYRLAELRRDYGAMQEMITGDRPSWEEILEYMVELEEEINGSV
ncbi:MAG: hypothetical protein U1E26_08855 [Coriobacteriia bacterium]|nr:hypothetical protein [Coriobacteriia bacterium]